MTVGALKSCWIVVSFSPGALGTESATLAVADSPDPLSPYTVATTPSPTIPATDLPTTLTYGTLTARVASKTLKTTVTNLSGFSLPLSESIIRSPNSSDFAVTGSGTCGSTLSPNSSCTIAVTFTPTAGGLAESARMAVTVGNDPSSHIPSASREQDRGRTDKRIMDQARLWTLGSCPSHKGPSAGGPAGVPKKRAFSFRAHERAQAMSSIQLIRFPSERTREQMYALQELLLPRPTRVYAVLSALEIKFFC